MIPFAENRRILYVDDEPELLNAFLSLMRKENFEIITLDSSEKINEVLNSGEEFAVVLSDQRMPCLNGVQVLNIIKEVSPESIRVLVTGYADYNDTINAINISQINSYIAKPWDDTQLKTQVKNWIAQYNLKKHNDYLLQCLDEENRKLNELLNGTITQTVRILGDLVKNVSPQVAELGDRVKSLGIAILNLMPAVPSNEKWDIMCALDLFNLGIALLPPAIQVNIARVGMSAIAASPVSFHHQLLAAGILRDIPQFASVARIIELHAKYYDGTGEPENDKTKGSDLPLGSRLLRILIDLVRPATKLRGTDLLKFMERQPGKYDAQLIKMLLGKQIETNFIAEEKLLPVNSLLTGMMLVEDVRSLNGQLLLKANTILSDTFLNIIRQWHSRDPLVEPIKVKCI